MFSAAGALVAVALTITTQNVRYTLPPDQARHDIAQAAEHSSVLVTQEMGFRHAASYAPAGWGTAHFLGSARGDCATYWKRSTWQLARFRLVRLTDGAFIHGRRFALVTTFRGQGTSLAVVCLHLITSARDRTATERAGVQRLAQLVDHLQARWGHVVVGGDWNTLCRSTVPGFPRDVLTRHGMRTHCPGQQTGPKGGRIDFFYWQHPGAWYLASRVIGHTYSDHQGFRLHLGLR